MILHQKSLFLNNFLLISMFWLKIRKKHKKYVMCYFRKKIYCREKGCIFFVFLYQQMKIWKKPLKSHFLGRIFFFNAYIILLKGGSLLNAVNTPKNVEKHVIYVFFRKKYIMAIFSVFSLFFDGYNEICRKSSKDSLFRWKELFSWNYI